MRYRVGQAGGRWILLSVLLVVLSPAVAGLSMPDAKPKLKPSPAPTAAPASGTALSARPTRAQAAAVANRNGDKGAAAKGANDKSGDAIKVGDSLPSFTLTALDGKTVESTELYRDKPVVLLFYRGGWCPYCNTGLKSFQEKLGDVEKLGASVAAVSPEALKNAEKTKDKDGLSYGVYSDASGAGMTALKLKFEMDEKTRTRYKGYGLDLASHNATGKWELPHPATFVIDTKGKVRYAYVNKDFTKRAKPEDVLEVLRKMQAEAKAPKPATGSKP